MIAEGSLWTSDAEADQSEDSCAILKDWCTDHSSNRVIGGIVPTGQGGNDRLPVEGGPVQLAHMRPAANELPHALRP
jgi:hypothetical protein